MSGPPDAERPAPLEDGPFNHQPARHDDTDIVRQPGTQWSALSTRALAAALGMSKSTIARQVADAASPERVLGVDGKTYPSKKLHTKAVPTSWLIQLRSAGLSYRAIATEAGVSHQTVMRLFHNLVQVSQSGQVDQVGAGSGA